MSWPYVLRILTCMPSKSYCNQFRCPLSHPSFHIWCPLHTTSHLCLLNNFTTCVAVDCIFMMNKLISSCLGCVGCWLCLQTVEQLHGLCFAADCIFMLNNLIIITLWLGCVGCWLHLQTCWTTSWLATDSIFKNMLNNSTTWLCWLLTVIFTVDLSSKVKCCMSLSVNGNPTFTSDMTICVSPWYELF